MHKAVRTIDQREHNFMTIINMKNMFMKNIKNENSLKRLIYIFRVVVRNICGAYVTEF